MRLVIASTTIASALTGILYAVPPQPTQCKQIYVKIVWPVDPVNGKMEGVVVESWIAKQLKKQGLSKFTAATEWVPLGVNDEEQTLVWDGALDGKGV